jgi:hypothetical protein
MFRWSIDLHNLVNSQLNKPEVPYEQAYRYWSARCARGPDDKQRTVLIVSVVLLILAALFFYIR